VIDVLDRRARLWRSLGASPALTEELLAYAQDHFDYGRLPSRYPLPDEPFVAVWSSYLDRSQSTGLWACLRQELIELRFPIQSGISQSEPYRAATRRGDLGAVLAGPGLVLSQPEGLSLSLHPTPAGRIPVLVVQARADFVALTQALTRRNEPAPIPRSMGACMVAGYNNWGRIFALPGWERRLKEISATPALYQDRFILLCAGPYSDTAAADLGLDQDVWHARSLHIRREHECTHYFTRQVLGSMRNGLLDELIADYMGLVASEEGYRADWLLRFMGLEDFPRFRAGGRLENYRGDPPLSEGAYRVLQSALHQAAHNLGRFDERRRARPTSSADPAAEKAGAIVALARLGLEGLAAEEAFISPGSDGWA
jgi:hypothetical protein